MTDPRTKITITPIEPDILLKKIWVGRLLINLINNHAIGTIVPLTEEGVTLFKEVMADGWTYDKDEVDIDLEKESITIK
jgi:hypothetical protein